MAEPPMRLTGDMDRHDQREGSDDYCQARVLHDLMDDAQRGRLYMNTAESMQGVPEEILTVALGHYDKVSQVYADGIRNALAEIAGAKEAAE